MALNSLLTCDLYPSDHIYNRSALIDNKHQVSILRYSELL